MNLSPIQNGHYRISFRSRSDSVLLSDPVEITMKPRNQQVRAGGIAAFYCAARGSPTPVIQWKKNGKRVSGKSENWPLNDLSRLRVPPGEIN